MPLSIMKHSLLSTLLIVLLCFPEPASAQKAGLPYNRFTGEITQTKVVQTGQSKAKTCQALRSWIFKTYPNYREIMKVDDPGTGKIVYQDKEPIVSEKFKSFSYRVSIDVKDGLYSCTIDQVRTLGPGSTEFTSADMDFPTIGIFKKDLDDVERDISYTTNKRELAKLYKERRTLKSFLLDYHKSHQTMLSQFNMIQNGLRLAVNGMGPLAAK
jgi:hypothetical protein